MPLDERELKEADNDAPSDVVVFGANPDIRSYITDSANADSPLMVVCDGELYELCNATSGELSIKKGSSSLLLGVRRAFLTQGSVELLERHRAGDEGPASGVGIGESALVRSFRKSIPPRTVPPVVPDDSRMGPPDRQDKDHWLDAASNTLFGTKGNGKSPHRRDLVIRTVDAIRRHPEQERQIIAEFRRELRQSG